MKWVIVYGGIFDGVQGVVGPFETEDEAEAYAESHNLGGFETAAFEMEDPK